jgi:hypothetical protein
MALLWLAVNAIAGLHGATGMFVLLVFFVLAGMPLVLAGWLTVLEGA